MRTARPTPTLFPPPPPPAHKPNPLKQFYPGLPIGNEDEDEDNVEDEQFVDNEDTCEDDGDGDGDEGEDVREDDAHDFHSEFLEAESTLDTLEDSVQVMELNKQTKSKRMVLK